MAKKKTGTREWAEVNVNIVIGCEHRCRYCYAADMAKRFGRIARWTNGATAAAAAGRVAKARKKVKGRSCFPPATTLRRSSWTMRHRAEEAAGRGERGLIVTKPHLECVERLCQELAAYKKKIVFRFTIGAMDDELLRFWEPGAPAFAERLASLKHAHGQGFRTSVSASPCSTCRTPSNSTRPLVPFVTDTIWFGKMNMVRKRVEVKTLEDEAAVQRIEDNQTDERIVELYERLKDKPKVAWKDSFKKIVGLTLEDG